MIASRVTAPGQARMATVKPMRQSTQTHASMHQANAAVLAAAASLLLASAPVQAAELVGVERTFAIKCAGCHQNGGNVLAAGASLFPDDLTRNGVAAPEELFALIYKGKGKMPGYGADCAPKGQCTFGPRLTDDEIKELASYVTQRASEGWK